MEQTFKRHTAHKLRISSLLSGKPTLENERLKHLDTEGKQVVRVNLIANIVDKYVQEGEKKFASITLDDGSGQIKAKAFGDEIEKFSNFQQGDTILLIGLLRSWNNEVYFTPEIIKKKEPAFLLIRKLEVEAEQPKVHDKEQLLQLKDKILNMIKEGEKSGGVEIEKIILELKEAPAVINQEIKRLLEDGIAYEPRPGRIRWLG